MKYGFGGEGFLFSLAHTAAAADKPDPAKGHKGFGHGFGWPKDVSPLNRAATLGCPAAYPSNAMFWKVHDAWLANPGRAYATYPALPKRTYVGWFVPNSVELVYTLRSIQKTPGKRIHVEVLDNGPIRFYAEEV